MQSRPKIVTNGKKKFGCMIVVTGFVNQAGLQCTRETVS
jgi:hypothetical protein